MFGGRYKVANDDRVSMIVGLGNPGPKYEDTRHNAGFMAVDRLRRTAGQTVRERHRYSSEIFHWRYGGRSMVILKPMTFMNLSGPAVAKAARVYKVRPENILVVYDCLDLPLGRLRFRLAGSSGGHKGMESVTASLGTRSIPRLRIGIDRRTEDSTADYVLSKWRQEERGLLEAVLDQVSEAVLAALRQGVEAAMNKYNSKMVNTESSD